MMLRINRVVRSAPVKGLEVKGKEEKGEDFYSEVQAEGTRRDHHGFTAVVVGSVCVVIPLPFHESHQRTVQASGSCLAVSFAQKDSFLNPSGKASFLSPGRDRSGSIANEVFASAPSPP